MRPSIWCPYLLKLLKNVLGEDTNARQLRATYSQIVNNLSGSEPEHHDHHLTKYFNSIDSKEMYPLLSRRV